jgi:sensor histidine kinase YesM
MTNSSKFLFKQQDFILFIGLTLWLAIFHITNEKTVSWSTYCFTVLAIGITLLPVLLFQFNKTNFKRSLSTKKYTIYWLVCFSLVQPVFSYLCILLAPPNFTPSFFITATVAALVLEVILTVNTFYQLKAKDAKWLKKIGLEKAVLISLILIALIIAIMGVSSLNNPLYHSKERLLIGFEFSPTKMFNHFGTLLSFFIQFLLMYLCGYSFFLINSRLLVSKILKKQGWILYLLSLSTTIAILYPIVSQVLISLPINKTLGRDIFADNAFDFENAFGVAGIMLFSLPIVLALQWGNQNTQILSLEKEKSQTELSLLKQQLNPHFFFNTLNNLYGLSLQQSEKTSESILQLAELMRYTIYKGQQDRVKLAQELNYINDYIQLQQIRLKKPLNFTFHKEIANEQIELAPLMLIVLIENAFKHGIETAEEAASLSLFLKSDQTTLYFSCENSFEEEDRDKIPGIGLNNLAKRLDLLYPANHQLKLTKTKNLYKAELALTL